MILYNKKKEEVIYEFVIPPVVESENYQWLEDKLIDLINEQRNVADVLFYAEDNEILDLDDRMKMNGNVYLYRDRRNLPELHFRGIPIKRMCEREIGVAQL